MSLPSVAIGLLLVLLVLAAWALSCRWFMRHVVDPRINAWALGERQKEIDLLAATEDGPCKKPPLPAKRIKDPGVR